MQGHLIHLIAKPRLRYVRILKVRSYAGGSVASAHGIRGLPGASRQGPADWPGFPRPRRRSAATSIAMGPDREDRSGIGSATGRGYRQAQKPAGRPWFCCGILDRPLIQVEVADGIRRCRCRLILKSRPLSAAGFRRRMVLLVSSRGFEMPALWL